ncbi:MAG TPA: hypothetical protein VHD90_17230 [Phototrophicaceae bacterium]|nr:hypothetical protein [Phototrophicaceae bacterium]
MTTIKENLNERILSHLNQTVSEAVTFFANADETLFDEHHSAHDVLAQLVFWHEQYVAVAQAIVDRRIPELKAGVFDQLNRTASSGFSSDSMTMLAYDLACLQREFVSLLHQIPDWTINFPIKADSTPCSLNQRLLEIDAHIRQHVLRLKRCR